MYINGKLFTGRYMELLDARIEYDGDYLVGKYQMRNVSNTFDNIIDHHVPDSYGVFVQGDSDERIKTIEETIRRGIRKELIRMGFPHEEVVLVKIPLIEGIK